MTRKKVEKLLLSKIKPPKNIYDCEILADILNRYDLDEAQFKYLKENVEKLGVKSSNVYLNFSQYCFYKKLLKQSFLYINKALKLNPKSKNCIDTKYRTCLVCGKYNIALKLLQKSKEAFSDEKQYNEMLFVAEKMAEDVNKNADLIINYDLKDKFHYYLFGLSSYYANNYDTALKFFLKAEKEHISTNIYYFLYYIYHKKEDYKKAQEYHIKYFKTFKPSDKLKNCINLITDIIRLNIAIKARQLSVYLDK